MNHEMTLLGRKPLGAGEARTGVADAAGGVMDMALLGISLNVGLGRSWT